MTTNTLTTEITELHAGLPIGTKTQRNITFCMKKFGHKYPKIQLHSLKLALNSCKDPIFTYQECTNTNPQISKNQKKKNIFPKNPNKKGQNSETTTS